MIRTFFNASRSVVYFKIAIAKIEDKILLLTMSKYLVKHIEFAGNTTK
jgi:hypothetical protein